MNSDIQKSRKIVVGISVPISSEDRQRLFYETKAILEVLEGRSIQNTKVFLKALEFLNKYLKEKYKDVISDKLDDIYNLLKDKYGVPIQNKQEILEPFELEYRK